MDKMTFLMKLQPRFNQSFIPMLKLNTQKFWNRRKISFRIIPVLLFHLMAFSLAAHDGAKQNHIHEVNAKYQLYQICQNDIDGYAKKISGDDITYHSIRVDVRDALISRANTGEMSFELLTSPVPMNNQKKEVTFFYYSDISLNLREPFDIKVNDRPLLTFLAEEDGTLSILDNPGKGSAEFVLVKRDNVGDGLGAFRLTVPTSFLEKGKQAKISVTGKKKNSNAWFMLFKVKDIIPWLSIAAKNEVAFNVKQFNDQLLIDAPKHFHGKSVFVISDGVKSKTSTFKAQGEISKASVVALPPMKNFQIDFDGEPLDVVFADGNGESSKSELVGSFFYTVHAHQHNGWNATMTKLYRPEYFEAYIPFIDSKYEKGLLSMLNSSHQDIAWVDRPEACIIMRDTLLLTPIIKDAFARDDYGFDIEDGLILKEYLIRHPEAKDKIAELLKRKLISVGASFNCPYEDMYDGEDLVRQFYLGKKWVKKTFGGYDSKVYWNVDVPGKTLQMPQILKKSGVDYMVISRHAKGLFHWISPDGSSVFGYSPGHYGNDVVQLSSEVGNQIKYGAEQFIWWSRFYKDTDTYAPLLSDADMLPAIDYSNFIETWNQTSQITDHNRQKKELHLPHMELMTIDEFMPLAENKATTADTLRGERPNVWVYIHGPAHHDALTASRRASKLIPAAEKFSTIAYLLDDQKKPYPHNAFDEAWQAKIYPDHGWGGHDGSITDDLFKENLVKSEVMGDQLLDDATAFIARRIDMKKAQGIPVVLFNSLSWERTDPVTVKVDLPKGFASNLEVFSMDGKTIPSQFENTERYGDGSIRATELTFVAKDVPSIGYKTFNIRSSMVSPKQINSTLSETEYENEFYRVTFENGGIGQVYDKELQRNLFKTDQFKVGEIFTLQSVGNGAGEFGKIQQPSLEDFDQVSKHKANWKIISNGPVFTTYRLSQPLENVIVEQDVTMFHQLKRVQFENRLRNWDGTLFREFRTAYPVDIESPLITHEVPFGKVRVGQDEIHSAGDRYTPLCKDVHPRAIMDWISASDNEMTVMLSSSVAAADWVNPTNTIDHSLLQHVLLASRTSCHWEGNDYAQQGNHSYRHILTSTAKDDMEGVRLTKQFNDPLKVIFHPEQSAKANLDTENSFFGIDKDHVIISTIKKAEDGEDIIVRMYDALGRSSMIELQSAFDTYQLRKTNIIEENPTRINEIEIPAFSIETFQLSVNK